jgi:hypothetical protein
MEAIKCIACWYWKSKTNESGWCTYGDETGRCVDGRLIRGLYPVTFAMDGCLLGIKKGGHDADV